MSKVPLLGMIEKPIVLSVTLRGQCSGKAKTLPCPLQKIDVPKMTVFIRNIMPRAGYRSREFDVFD